jgi:hypothetical protein
LKGEKILLERDIAIFDLVNLGIGKLNHWQLYIKVKNRKERKIQQRNKFC